jgi:hypothetical protein
MKRRLEKRKARKIEMKRRAEKAIKQGQDETIGRILSLQRMPLPETIRLLRVPKAGSSSFSAFLRLQFGCVDEKHPPGECTSNNVLACPAIHHCVAHAPIEPYSAFPMFTVVQDPIERYISAYYYPGHHGDGTHGNISLHVSIYHEWDNLQTKFFSGNRFGDWRIKKVRLKHPNERPAFQGPHSPQQAREWMINATQALYRTVFVGLVEYWDDSLKLFCRRFECVDETSDWRERANRNETWFSSYPYNDTQAMAAVRQANQLDLELYKIAKQRFCRDIQFYTSADDKFRESLSQKVLELCSKDRTSAAVYGYELEP